MRAAAEGQRCQRPLDYRGKYGGDADRQDEEHNRVTSEIFETHRSHAEQSGDDH